MTDIMMVQDIMRVLPHRYPFLLVDRVTEVEGETHCKGFKNITANEAWTVGHFPGMPIYPGVLIIESMAQLVGAFGLSLIKSEDCDVYLAGVDKVRFRRQVVPGDRLDMSGTITNRKRNIYFFDCFAHVDGQLAAQASITVVLGSKG